MPTRISKQTTTLPWALLAVAVLAAAPARGEEAGTPLAFTVHPSGLAEPEGLDERLARRERSFRFICIGCARVDGKVAEAPFRPVETLGAPGLSAALATEP